MLTKAKGVTVKDISKRLRVPSFIIKRAFNLLERKGLLKKVGDNTYSPTKDGIALYNRFHSKVKVARR